VTEQDDVVADLEAAGVFAGVHWAYASAATRSLAIYSEPDGHDPSLLGSLRFTIFRDRLDRVFGCERYAVSLGDVASDLDLLYAELTDQDVETMPRLGPGVVRRADLNGSPGWAHGDRRFLLASSVSGKLDRLPWPQRSETKQRVARQRNPQLQQPTLFDDFALEEVDGLAAAVTGPDQQGESGELDMATFVVAHSLDPLSHQQELVFGRPRLNAGGGQAWHWRLDLLSVPLVSRDRRTGEAAPTPDPNAVADAPVRLRPGAGQQQDGRARGQQHGGRARGER
jgi:hypothetical protein